MKKVTLHLRRKKTLSKRGMTLIELVVGIAIIVIVFGGTLGALTGGYTTTVKNADRNQVAVTCVSANELITTSVKNLKIEKKEQLTTPILNQISATVQHKYPSIKYVPEASFAINNMVDLRYTIVADAVSNVSGTGTSTPVKGILIKTAGNSSGGAVYNVAFVPYE